MLLNSMNTIELYLRDPIMQSVAIVDSGNHVDLDKPLAFVGVE